MEVIFLNSISNKFFQDTSTYLSKLLKKELDLESYRRLCKALLGY